MTSFLIFAALLTALAIAFVMVPLMAARFAGSDGTSGTKDTSSKANTLNLAVLRDQLRELEVDFKQGMINQAAYEAARIDLASRVSQDVSSETVSTSLRMPSPGLAMGLSLGVVLLVWCLYVSLGNFAAFDPAKVAKAGPHGGKVTQDQITTMITQLKDHLKANPEDAKGWAMLARTLGGLERFTEARDAFVKLLELAPNDPSVLTDAADTTAMAQGQSLQGEPEKLLQRALAIDPKHIKALILMGSVKYEREDFTGAVVDWRTLRAALPPNSDMLATVDENIREAESLIANKVETGLAKSAPGGSGSSGGSPNSGTPTAMAAAAPAAANAANSVSGTVKLDPALQKQVEPGDTVFVFAKAPDGGPRFPLAVVRKQVRDLPLQFRLDDSMGMVPEVKLSKFKDVQITARISKAGNAIPMPGDFEGSAGTVTLGSQNVMIVINKKRE
jgi:cytochrome c-type biogenesis protein CcmH